MVSSNQLYLICMYESILKKKGTYKSILDDDDRRYRYRIIPHSTILKFCGSAFMYLYTCGNNQGFDHEKFQKLLQVFSGTYNTHMFDLKTGNIKQKTIGKGRPREIDAIGGLDLVLVWFHTRGACTRTLSLIFGQTSTPLYKWLKFAKSVLLYVLIQLPDAEIKQPSIADVRLFQDAIYQIIDDNLCQDNN